LNDRLMALGRTVLAGVFAGALSLAQTPCAWAQTQGTGKAAQTAKPDIASAKKHYGDGERKYKAGDYAGACADFKAANDVKSTPQAERYVGLCEDAQGHFQTAAEWYDRFLAHVPDKMAVQGDEIRKRAAEIKALPGKVHIDSSPPGATVTVDDAPQSAPTPMDIDLPPGAHTVKLTEKGRLPTEKHIDVVFASSQTIGADLDPAPPPPPEIPPPPVVYAMPASPAPPPPQPRSLLPAYVTGGLAIVAAGVGTVFGVMALNDRNDFDNNPTSHTADNGDTHALISDMSFGVALTFGITSAVLFLTRDESQPAAGATSQAGTGKKSAISVVPTPMVGPHSGGGGVLVRF
jgi:hypothetical protein